jgi:hypothetical protein
VNDTAQAFNEPGRFVTFPGYEWSGNTPLGGDRNVYFAGAGGAIVHSCTDLLPGKRSAYETASTAAELFKALARQKEGPQPFATAHVGGRYADLSMHDPDIELAVEVHSAWGTFEWLVEDALQRGYRVGICANSDGHKGRPGASYPGASKFGSYGGLTCVLAPRLDRKRVLGALQARHFYATTGHRCLLDVRLALGESPWAMMGDVVPVTGDALHLRVRVVGTAPIERVEVRNGLDVVRTVRPYAEADLGPRVKVVWSGAEVRGRARMSTWDGYLSVQDNSILDVEPINFWNPDQQPEIQGARVAWRSVTTGGLAGLILTLREPHAGSISLVTAQREATCTLDEIGLEPRVWDCGGLRKRIDVYRLAERAPAHAFSFSLPVPRLREGDNPIYVKVVQEDGHMAWTSPIYLVK